MVLIISSIHKYRVPDCRNFKLTRRLPGASINQGYKEFNPFAGREKRIDLLRKDGRTAEGNIGCSPAVFSLSGQLNLKRREVNIYEYCQKGPAGKTRICLDDQT